MNKKGFTLIELLAVIVILAIIALIATPIVMNTISKAQEGADLRSVEAYGKEIESLYYQALIENPTVTPDLDALSPSISGNEVTNCTATIDNSDSDDDKEFHLAGCKVGDRGPYVYSSKTGAKVAE